MAKSSVSKSANKKSSTENINASDDYCRSFHESSIVTDNLKRRLDENIVIDYEGLTYVRYMKLFTPHSLPIKMKDFGTKFPAKEEVDLAKCINAPFHYRCYLPKNWITKIDNENFSHIKRVVVMFNGMNEDDKFDFYDILGEHFCNNNMAAILLPTPLHLNRRVARGYKIERKNRPASQILPTDWTQTQPILFYQSFLKSYNELMELIHKINPPKGRNKNIENSFLQEWKDEVDKAFYKKHFWKDNEKPRNTEIILLGYSLGGLRSLCYFMHDPQKFRCCITFNSGPNLFAAHSDKLQIDPQEWENMLNALETEVSEYSAPRTFEKIAGLLKYERISKEKNENRIKLLRDLFLAIYCGESRPKVKKLVQDGSEHKSKHPSYNDEIFKRYLAITSGSDKIVDIDSLNHIAPKNKHVHQLIVSGVDHNPATDQNWHEVLPRVENNIVNFIEVCVDEHYKRQDIADKIREVLGKTDSYRDHVDEYITKRIKQIDKFPRQFGDKEFQKLLKEIPKADYSALKINLGKHRSYVEYFLDLFYSSKGYYLNFSELYKKMLRDEQRISSKEKR